MVPPYVRVGKYIVKKKIGEGAFAEVRLAVHEETKEEYAVKVFNRSLLPRAQFERDVKKEIRIMQHLRHPNIVSIHAVLVTATKMYLVMELVRGGELYDEIVANGRIEEHVARKYFQQLVDALAYCHKRGVVHRDLKPENILLDGHGNVKITDFGMSWIKSANNDANTVLLSTQCGTPKYMPPELIMLPDAGYDGPKLDVWECGMVLFALLAGYLPFAGDDDNAVFRSILNGRVKFPDFFSDSVKHLLSTILVKDPEKRASMEDIRHHPWFLVDYQGDENPEGSTEMCLSSPRISQDAQSSPSTLPENQQSPDPLKIKQDCRALKDVTNKLRPQDPSHLCLQTSCSNPELNNVSLKDPTKNSTSLWYSPEAYENTSLSPINRNDSGTKSTQNRSATSLKASSSSEEGQIKSSAPLHVPTLPKSTSRNQYSEKTKKSTTVQTFASHDSTSPILLNAAPPKRRSTIKAIKLPRISAMQRRATMNEKLEEMDDEPDEPELTETIIAGTPSPRPSTSQGPVSNSQSSAGPASSTIKSTRKMTLGNSIHMDNICSPRIRLPRSLKSFSPTGLQRNSGRGDASDENLDIEQEAMTISPISSSESPMKAILRNIRSVGSALRIEQGTADLDTSTSWFDSVSSTMDVTPRNEIHIRKDMSSDTSKLLDIHRNTVNSPRTTEPISSPWKYLSRGAFSRGK